MSNLSTTDIRAVLEELYLKDNVIPDLIYRNNPVLGILPKSTEGGGKYRHVHVKHVRPQGRSASFASAQANRVGSKRVAFDVDWRNNYQIGALDGNVIRQARGNRVILIEHVKDEIDEAIANVKDDIAGNVFRNHGGARGRIASLADTNSTITLTDPTDVAHFEVGMRLNFSANDGSASGHSLRTGSASDDAVPIVAVDRDAGILYVTGNADTLAGAQTSDYIFVVGDFKSKWSGFDSWIPGTAPSSSDDFYGVDRSVDPVRLAGVRYNGAGEPIEQALMNGASRIARWKRSQPIDLVALNPIRWTQLEISLEGRKQVQTVKGTGPAADIGYEAIMLATPAGKVPVVSDPNCQMDIAWMLNKESWMIETCGEMIDLINNDGLEIMRQHDGDGFEFRLVSLGNVWCKEPGSNARVALA
jgi:hypothetical protein